MPQEKEISEEELKDALSKISDTLGAEQDAKSLNSPFYQEIVRLRSQRPYEIDPESLFYSTTYPFENALELFIKRDLGIQNHHAIQVYLHYQFLKWHVANIMETLYGSMCSVDRAHCVLARFLNNKVTGVITEFHPEDPKNYHHPETGSFQEWMDFVDACISLYYGHTEKFFKAYAVLLKGRPHVGQ